MRDPNRPSPAKGVFWLVVGFLLAAAGIAYIAVPASELPSIQPQHLHGGPHDIQSGFVLLVVGLLCVVGGALAWPRSPIEDAPPRPVIGAKEGTPRPILGTPGDPRPRRR